MNNLIQFVNDLTRLVMELKYLVVAIIGLWFVARPAFYLWVKGATGEVCRWTATYYFKINPAYKMQVRKGQIFPKGYADLFFQDGIWEIDIYKRSTIAKGKKIRSLRWRQFWAKKIRRSPK